MLGETAPEVSSLVVSGLSSSPRCSLSFRASRSPSHRGNAPPAIWSGRLPVPSHGLLPWWRSSSADCSSCLAKEGRSGRFPASSSVGDSRSSPRSS